VTGYPDAVPAFPAASRHAIPPFTSTAVHPESSDGEVTRHRGADARLLIRPVSFQLPRLQSGIEEPRSGRRILRRSAPPDRVSFMLSCNKQTRSALFGVLFRGLGQSRETVMAEFTAGLLLGSVRRVRRVCRRRCRSRRPCGLLRTVLCCGCGRSCAAGRRPRPWSGSRAGRVLPWPVR
jgi:hypothetical protein